MEHIDLSAEKAFDTQQEETAAEAVAISLEDIATREVQGCACVCHYTVH
jgi:hypothetical protein